MKIKEAQLRSMIRHALILEVTARRGSQQGSLRLNSMKEEDCDYMRAIPTKLAGILQSSSAKEFETLLTKQFPKLKADLGIIGVGRNAAGLKDGGFDPKNIGDLSDSKNGAELLAGYFNSYLYATGFGCLQFYYLGVLLDFLGSFLGVGVVGQPANKNTSNSGSSVITWRNGIIEEANRRVTDSTGFVNNLPFYALPTLAAKGPEEDNVKALKADLKAYQQKIDDIRNIRESNIKSAFTKISSILETGKTKYIKSFDTSALPGDDKDLVNKLKSNAITDLLIVMGDARLCYNEVINLNGDFSIILKDFFRRNQ